MDLEEIYNTYNQFDPEKIKYPNVSNENSKIFCLRRNDSNDDELDLKMKFPVMETNYFKSNLKSIKLLNECNDAENERNIFEAWFQFDSEEEINILPGDSFGFLIGNFDEEVKELLKIVSVFGLDDTNIVDFENLKQPFYPKETLYKILKYYVELRAVPSKSCLCLFGKSCEDEKERNCLMFLSSKEGSKLYEKYILKQNMGMLDILKYFKTCKPGIKAFLINAINFTPRYYSVIDYLVDKKEKYEYQIKIAFSVTHLPKILNRENTQLLGIFTGKMEKRFNLENNLKLKNNSKNSLKENECDVENIVNNLKDLSLNQSYFIFKRKNIMFRMSDKIYSNTILVSVGTGITPFLSFFNYIKKNKIENTNIWLIHGSRQKEDCLYLDELINHKKSNLINQLQLCYSRVLEENNYKYVQEYIKEEKKLKELIYDDDSVIYVCGDVKKMAKDVHDAFLYIIDNDIKKMKELQVQKRYLQDVWY